MSTDRKLLVLVGALCVLGFLGGLLALGFLPLYGRPLWFFPISAWIVVCYWLGSAIAAVLKNDPEK
jgi:hypothetical protein